METLRQSHAGIAQFGATVYRHNFVPVHIVAISLETRKIATVGYLFGFTKSFTWANFHWPLLLLFRGWRITLGASVH